MTHKINNVITFVDFNFALMATQSVEFFLTISDESCKTKSATIRPITLQFIEVLFSVFTNEKSIEGFLMNFRNNIVLSEEEIVIVLKMFKDSNIRSKMAIVLFHKKSISYEMMLKVKEMFVGTDEHFFIMHAFADKMNKLNSYVMANKLMLSLTDSQKDIYVNELKQHNLIDSEC